MTNPPKSKLTIAELIALFGPHELVALICFLCSLFVWAVTLREFFTCA